VNPFERLRDLQARIASGEGVTDDEAAEADSTIAHAGDILAGEPGNNDGDFLADLMSKKPAVDRPTRAPEEDVKALVKGRLRIPLLKRPGMKVITPQKTIDQMTVGELKAEAKKRGVTIDSLLHGTPSKPAEKTTCTACAGTGVTPIEETTCDTCQGAGKLPCQCGGFIEASGAYVHTETCAETYKRAAEESTLDKVPDATLSMRGGEPSHLATLSMPHAPVLPSYGTGDGSSPSGVPPEMAPPGNPLAEAVPARHRLTVYREPQELDVARILTLPNVVCNYCAMAEKCEEFKENSTCAFEEDLQGLPSRDVDNVLPFLETVATLHQKRALRAVMMEGRQAGGILDPNVTRQLEVAAQAVERVAKYKLPVQQAATRGVAVIQQGGGGGTEEKGPGLISTLMAAFAPKPQVTETNELVLNAPVPQAPITAVVVQETVTSPAPGRYEAQPLPDT
jgi:hypothetical protein